MIDFGPNRKPDLARSKLPDAIQFASCSEAACALQLEFYSNTWRCKPGETYQVNLGHGRKADFKIGHTIVEYHPIVLKHEFRSQGYYTFIRGFYQAPKKAQEFLREGLDEHFKAEYYAKRAMAIDLSPDTEIRKCDLLCVHSPLEFASRVLVTLCNVKERPEALAAEFVRIVKAVKRLCR